MVKKTLKLLLLIPFFSCGISLNSQKLKNIKYFKNEILKQINTVGYYQCTNVYFADSHYNIKKKLNNDYKRTLKFKNDGYIESNASASNKDGNSGVIYLKNSKLKIDLIGGTSDRSKIIRTYKVKIEGSKLHLLEESAVINELIYYVYELKNK